MSHPHYSGERETNRPTMHTWFCTRCVVVVVVLWGKSQTAFVVDVRSFVRLTHISAKKKSKDSFMTTDPWSVLKNGSWKKKLFSYFRIRSLKSASFSLIFKSWFMLHAALTERQPGFSYKNTQFYGCNFLPLACKKSSAVWLSIHANKNCTNEEVAVVVMWRYQKIIHLIEPNTWLSNRGHQLNQLETA